MGKNGGMRKQGGKALAQGGTKGTRGIQASEGKWAPCMKSDVKEKAARVGVRNLGQGEAAGFLKHRMGKKVRDLRADKAALAEPDDEEAPSMAVEEPEPISEALLAEAAARRAADLDEDAPEAESSRGDVSGRFDSLFHDNPGREAENSRKRFYAVFRKVLGLADIVLEVLDARDPGNCRSTALEKEVVAAGKRLVLVLNKIDLVPKHSVEAWMKHLKRSFPVIAFKAAQCSGGTSRVTHANTSAANAPEGLLRSTNGVVGADELMQLLKNYARTGIATKKAGVCVGVVGYPNTGKSSIINSMKRHSCVEVGGRSGVTKDIQEIKLDSKVTLVDSPGVVFEGATDDPSTVLRNVVRVESVSDPVGVVDALLKKAPREALMKFYNCPDIGTVRDFLVHVGRVRGKMKRGGSLDLENAARSVILDWTLGKFRYFTMPPVDSRADAIAAEEETAAVLTQLAPAFDIDFLFSGAGEWQPTVLGAPTERQGDDDDAMSDGGEVQVQVDTEAMGL